MGKPWPPVPTVVVVLGGKPACPRPSQTKREAEAAYPKPNQTKGDRQCLWLDKAVSVAVHELREMDGSVRHLFPIVWETI